MASMWDEIKILRSTDKSVAKLIFQNRTAVAEAVLYRYPHYTNRTVICCSTMSGCMIGCRFCGSGDHYVRNLGKEEILDQIYECMELVWADEKTEPEDIKKFQIMFMSMGEPMLNQFAVMSAIEVLHGKYPNAQLLLSTIAPRVNYEPLMELSVEIPTIGLQFSIHESTDEARDKLIPFEKKLTLKEIAALGTLWAIRTHRQPFLNYCAHEHNTTEEDADRLAALFPADLFQMTVSVVCERDEHVAAANERQRHLANEFMMMLLRRGFSCRLFNPAGQDDIGGGCGQLWYVQDWMHKHPDLVRASSGFGLDTLHTPKD